MNKVYGYGKQNIDQDDIDAVVDVLKSDWLTQGPKIQEFETELTLEFKAKYATAVANGTAGLHLIGMALGWKKDDIIITSPITFLASANCIVYNNATPDFVDIDKEYYTIDINKLEDKIKKLLQDKKKVKAVVAVDYAGQPCDWKELRFLADKYEFQLVNDFCHAMGAEYENDFYYAAKYADVVNLSFHPVKHITTGEGGAVLANDTDIDSRIKVLRTHGMTKDINSLSKNEGPWYYEMHELGFNYRITDFQCALGISQLKKLNTFVDERNKIAEKYNQQFENDRRFIIPSVKQNVKHAFHLYPLQIDFVKVKSSKKELFEKLKEKNIHLQVHYIPVHLQPYYKTKFGFKEGDFPVSESFYRNEISIPMYPGLNDDDIDFIAKSIKDVLV